jgi:hypothetical protein
VNTLPTSLVHFESQLEDAIRRDHRRRPRRLALRLAVVGVAAAAMSLGVLSALPGDDPSAVARAAAVLNPTADTVLHTVVVTTRVDPDGTRSTGRTEAWQQNSPPYDGREVSGTGNHSREIATANGRPEAYVALTNTIYTVVPGTKLPPASRPDTGEQRLVRYMRNLLASGEAREDGRLAVGGREAIRIVSSDSKLTLVVDAESFEPIEWHSVSDEGSRLVSRFETYELLPATPANLALLSLRAQHPDAAVEPGVTVEGF